MTTVLVGGAVGAGLAFVLAPKSGSETRNDLKRIANRFTQAVDIGKDIYGEGREFVGEAVEAGKKAYVEEKPLEPIISDRGSLLMPILAGGIIGAGIALLLAPKSGSETRDDLKQFASSTRESVVTAMDKGNDLYVAGKDAITDAVEAGKKAFVEKKDEFLHAV